MSDKTPFLSYPLEKCLESGLPSFHYLFTLPPPPSPPPRKRLYILPVSRSRPKCQTKFYLVHRAVMLPNRKTNGWMRIWFGLVTRLWQKSQVQLNGRSEPTRTTINKVQGFVFNSRNVFAIFVGVADNLMQFRTHLSVVLKLCHYYNWHHY